MSHKPFQFAPKSQTHLDIEAQAWAKPSKWMKLEQTATQSCNQPTEGTKKSLRDRLSSIGIHTCTECNGLMNPFGKLAMVSGHIHYSCNAKRIRSLMKNNPQMTQFVLNESKTTDLL